MRRKARRRGVRECERRYFLSFFSQIFQGTHDEIPAARSIVVASRSDACHTTRTATDVVGPTSRVTIRRGTIEEDSTVSVHRQSNLGQSVPRFRRVDKIRGPCRVKLSKVPREATVSGSGFALGTNLLMVPHLNFEGCH